MNYKSKYLIVKRDARNVPIVFGGSMGHDVMAQGFDREAIVGAGFCYIAEDGQYACYGRSTALGIKSKPRDAGIINQYLGMTRECW